MPLETGIEVWFHGAIEFRTTLVTALNLGGTLLTRLPIHIPELCPTEFGLQRWLELSRPIFVPFPYRLFRCLCASATKMKRNFFHDSGFQTK
jgi:hypothetical protein